MYHGFLHRLSWQLPNRPVTFSITPGHDSFIKQTSHVPRWTSDCESKVVNLASVLSGNVDMEALKTKLKVKLPCWLVFHSITNYWCSASCLFRMPRARSRRIFLGSTDYCNLWVNKWGHSMFPLLPSGIPPQWIGCDINYEIDQICDERERCVRIWTLVFRRNYNFVRTLETIRKIFSLGLAPAWSNGWL